MKKLLKASRTARLASTCFASISGAHLLTQLFAPTGVAADITQVGLMPALAALLYSVTQSPRSRLTQLGFGALFFSWLGDTLPRFLTGDIAFLSMVGGFLVAQVIYAVAFWPHRAQSILARPLLTLPYIGAVIAMIAFCLSGAGSLMPAVLAYECIIALMAILATGLGKAGTWGGIIFLLSDSLIAMNAFTEHALPFHGFCVMVTYIVAQALLVFAIYGTETQDERAEDRIQAAGH